MNDGDGGGWQNAITRCLVRTVPSRWDVDVKRAQKDG